MQIHGEIRHLPPGVSVAAERRMIDGEDVILVMISDGSTGLPEVERQDVLDMFCDAVNALAAAPERRGPVLMPAAS